MITKNELKYYSSLLQKKFRREENKFIVEGEKIVLEGLKSNFECEIVICTNQFSEDNINILKELKAKNIRAEIIKNIEFVKLSDTINPQGIAAVFKKTKPGKIAQNNILVGLEDISDPGNLGTIIRNCDWFGITEIILSKDCAEIFNPKTIRASMGSVFHTNIFEEIDLPEEIKKIKKGGYEILCTDLVGESVYSHKPSKKTFIIFSNEAHGSSGEIKNLADYKITIPKKGKAESLNVASASAIILSELSKRT